MVAPGPDEAQLERILSVALRTPDHGMLAPWRFVTVGSDQRDDFAALLDRAMRDEDPGAPAIKRDKAITFAHQAPTLVVAIASPIDNHKIPVWEQTLSCGAAAMNLLHAAHALGFVGGWLTGWATYSPLVRKSFCKDHEKIAGFIFLGSPGNALEDRPRPDPAAVYSRWQGYEGGDD